MNIRSKIIHLALDNISNSQELVGIEIGCMFKGDEGLSTHIISKNILNKGGEFYSLDIDQYHIDSCKALLTKLGNRHVDRIRFMCNDSLTSLSQIESTIDKIDFCLVDGGAHPDVCLAEFEWSLNRLSEHGIIIVDDVHSIPSTPNYHSKRSFGKATLILPYILTNQFLSEQNSSNSRWIKELRGTESSSYKLDYALYGKDHKLLVVAKEKVIKQINSSLSDKSAIDRIRDFYNLQKESFKALLR